MPTDPDDVPVPEPVPPVGDPTRPPAPAPPPSVPPDEDDGSTPPPMRLPGRPGTMPERVAREGAPCV
jgi:hypothetical protein